MGWWICNKRFVKLATTSALENNARSVYVLYAIKVRRCLSADHVIQKCAISATCTSRENKWRLLRHIGPTNIILYPFTCYWKLFTSQDLFPFVGCETLIPYIVSQINPLIDLYILYTVNDIIQSLTLLKTWKLERSSITSKFVLTQHGNRHRQHFWALDMEITMWLSNTHTNNIHHKHGIPPVIPKSCIFMTGTPCFYYIIYGNCLNYLL